MADYPEHATAWFRNVQTRMIAGLCASYLGRYVAPDRVGLGGVVLSTAKRHLDEEYRAFGLTERFQASRRWMADTLGLEISPIEKQYKTNPERPTADELPSSKREALRRLNRLDVAFYDYALDLFDQKQGRA